MLGADDYLQHAKAQVIAGRLYDQYGYAWRNCTSYCAIQAAFNMGKPAPLLGNGGNWYENAGLKGIPRGLIPKQFAFAVFLPDQNEAGPEGHVALVDQVNDDSTINVSEYNFLNPLAFGTREHVAVDGLRFVYYYTPPAPKPVPTPTTGEKTMFVFEALDVNKTVAVMYGDGLRWRHLSPTAWATMQKVIAAAPNQIVKFELGTNQNLADWGEPLDAASAAQMGVPFTG